MDESMRDFRWILGRNAAAETENFSEHIAFHDHKIAFVLRHVHGKEVLDLGCVQHNPENYKSRYWLHKAIAGFASRLEGMDLYSEGVLYLRERGYNVSVGDATKFNLGRRFEVIVVGDLIEHLENFEGFIESCQAHLRPAGKLLISSPNPWYWRNVVKAILRSEVANNPEHTCWLCPRTLRQLVRRHGMDVVEVSFGSRYLRDRVMPLPKGVKHTSFHAVVMDVEHVTR
jgi:2-polyprenyl-3-methyl-5-hydroxy-6-metoxy-1,4-benzoquinol methylase